MAGWRHKAHGMFFQALVMKEDSVKALYRRAQAYRHKDEFVLAEADLSLALALQPEEVALRREEVLLRSRIKAYERRSRQVFRAMLNPAKERAVRRSQDEREVLVEGVVGEDDVADDASSDTASIMSDAVSVGSAVDDEEVADIQLDDLLESSVRVRSEYKSSSDLLPEDQ